MEGDGASPSVDFSLLSMREKAADGLKPLPEGGRLMLCRQLPRKHVREEEGRSALMLLPDVQGVNLRTEGEKAEGLTGTGDLGEKDGIKTEVSEYAAEGRTAALQLVKSARGEKPIADQRVGRLNAGELFSALCVKETVFRIDME